jgi:hypothetical protein
MERLDAGGDPTKNRPICHGIDINMLFPERRSVRRIS